MTTGRPVVAAAKSAAPAAVILAAIVAGGCGSAAEQLERRDVLRVAVLKAGPHESLSGIVAREYERSFPNQFQRVVNEGSVATVQAIERGEVDIGVAGANVAYSAFADGFEGAPLRQLRAIALVQMAVLHLLVRPDSDIRSVGDLRGRRVNVGPSGSGLPLIAGLVMRAYGMRPEDIEAERVPSDEAPAALAAGKLDAVFLAAHYPADSVKAATESGARLVSIEGSALERLHREVPFLRPVSIPGASYPGAPEAVRTVAVDVVLVCRRDLDEQLVFDLTRQFTDVLSRLPGAGGPLGPVDLNQTAATPIPLHEGAARFYRERELRR